MYIMVYYVLMFKVVDIYGINYRILVKKIFFIKIVVLYQFNVCVNIFILCCLNILKLFNFYVVKIINIYICGYLEGFLDKFGIDIFI